MNTVDSLPIPDDMRIGQAIVNAIECQDENVGLVLFYMSDDQLRVLLQCLCNRLEER
jgi:hypothetical protein